MSYITRTELRNYLGLTGTNHDAILDTYIESASEACDIYTFRTKTTLGSGFLTHSNVTERHWINEEARVVLEEWPVVSISSVTLRGDAVVLDTDYFLRTQEGIMTFFDGSGYRKKETGPIVVSYIAGYPSVPNRVRTVCLRLGSYWFSRKTAEGMGAQLIGDMQETFRLPEVTDLLDEELIRLRLDGIGIGGI